MIAALLVAASLAGQTPVQQMVDVCRVTMDSRVGKLYLALDDKDPFDQRLADLREQRRRAFNASVIFEASRRNLDVKDATSVCGAMIISRMEGQNEGLGQRVFVIGN